MSNDSDLDDYYNRICKKLITLKALRDTVITSGETRLTDWLQSVKQKEDEIDELGKELKHEKSKVISFKKGKLEERLKSCLEKVSELITNKDAISWAMDAFIDQAAKGRPKKYSLDQIKKCISNPNQELGHGVFGVVYKGTLDGVQVAIKVLHNNLLMDTMEKEFQAEVDAMSKLYHKNLAELYGFCFDRRMKALVYEYVDNGSLDQILYTNPSSISWKQLYQISIGIAEGLSYLHHSCNKHIVHRDIKAGNVLLNSKFLSKLTDFGLAKISSTDGSQVALTKNIRRARSFDAPEVRQKTSQTINYRSDTSVLACFYLRF